MFKYLILLSPWIFLSWNCTHSHPVEEPVHVHTDEVLANIQISGYDKNLEMFTEYEPLIAGEDSEFYIHLTGIPDFKPFGAAEILATLKVDGNQATGETRQLFRPGIFKLTLLPETDGTGELEFRIIYKGHETIFTFTDIIIHDGYESALHSGETNQAGNPNSIQFTKESSWKIDFATDFPSLEPFDQVIRTIAEVKPAPGDEVLITARSHGIVQFITNNIIEGNRIHEDQSLLTVSGRTVIDNNPAVRMTEAESDLVRAEADYRRYKSLGSEKLITEEKLLEAKNILEKKKAIYDNLKKNLGDMDELVKSPASGFINQIFVSNGQHVEAGQPLLTLLKNHKQLLIAEVQQKYIPILSSIYSANISIPESDQFYTLEELNGKLLSIGKHSVSPNSYLIPVTFAVDNVGAFITGSLVEMFLRTRISENALTVPNSALVEEQGNYFVYVQINPELFEKRQVITGDTDGTRTRINRGLSSDERIVTKGAIIVKLSASNGMLDAHAGHVH